jgi:hypothetical protein
MKTQISRESFKSDKRYSGVYLQQGRMITDADWNEATEISHHRLDDALADIVIAGVPRQNGMRVDAVAGQPLRLRRGRVYAGGVGALVTSTLADPIQPFLLSQQTDFPLPDSVTPPATGYRLYVDVWDRAVTSLEDPSQLRDPAFHGADTASRTQTMAQLKWCNVNVDPEDPDVNPRIGNARATLTLRSQLTGLDPCDPCARDVAVPPRIGNYLFRLEVHSVEGGPKNPTRIVLKWSTENGAEQHAVTTEPADFKGSDWVYEFFTPRTERHLGNHLTGGITPLAGQLVEGFPAAAPTGFTFVRRWDGYAILHRVGNVWSIDDGRERGVDLSTGSAADADGHAGFAANAFGAQLSTMTVDLTVSNAISFVAGDYWVAPVRESIHTPGSIVLDDAPPTGILHSYLLLATIDGNGLKVPPDTNRQQRLDFPSLTTLAARDVDYTTNCGSGLFDATHDTVQKALDRVCGINATHVAFTKPCDTSIFRNVDPVAINTVAKALALLCNVRADQISYANDAACTTLAGATTVQQALHLLCMRESGSGCRTTIGVGGEFPTLKAAVDAGRARRQQHFCFCLLPGNHIVSDPISLSGSVVATPQIEPNPVPVSGAVGILIPPPELPPVATLSFCLDGCGSASTLTLNANLSFDGLAAVCFNDVGMSIGTKASITAVNGKEVVFEGCVVTARDHEVATAPITVSASELLRIVGNNVQVTSTRRIDIFLDIVKFNPALKTLFAKETADRDFGAAAAAAAEEIAALPIADRRKLASAVDKAVKDRSAEKVAVDRRVVPEEKAAIERVSKVVTANASGVLSATIQQELIDVRRFLLAQDPSLAIVIAAAGGLADLTGNQIVGIVSVYGRPGEIQPPEIDQQLTVVRRLLFDRQLNLQSREEALLVTRNTMSQLRIGGEMTIAIRNAGQQGSKTIAGLFRSVRLTDNVFTLSNSAVACVETTLSGNRFANGARFATIIADTAFYFGNHAAESDGFLLRSVARRTNVATRADLNSVNIQDA